MFQGVIGKVKLRGNRVLLVALDPKHQWAASGSGLLLPNTWNKTNLKFQVLDVGPGEWKVNPRTKKKRWVQPEVEIGDYVLSRHWLDEGPRPPVYLDDVDGSGRVIVDAQCLLAVWKDEPTDKQSGKV